ncbi:MAG: cation-translocating P-type ATPase [Hyphomicrobium sp.]
MIQATRWLHRGYDRFALTVTAARKGTAVHYSTAGRNQSAATAIAATCIAQALWRGEISLPGIWMPEEVVTPSSFFQALAERQLPVQGPAGPHGSNKGRTMHDRTPDTLGTSSMAPMWYAVATPEVVARLESDPQRGLATSEAARRLAHDGPNALRCAERLSAVRVFGAQFRSLVVWVLLGAAAISLALGEYADSLAIAAIIVLNAAIGFFQEYRAEQAIAALARLAAPRARVMRDGRAATVPAAEVVRGDVLLLDAGDLVAADARLVEAAQLRTNEAPLTGESEPVGKRIDPCAPEAALADRRNMVFLGTSVANGSGRALVVATGMATEVGHIAGLLETASSGETPLQRRLNEVARRLLWASGAIVLLIFALGLLRALPIGELFLGAASLAVAAIPEGLPAVVTVALALGVSRMVRRNALIRHLPAVETLGSAQVICTDKTGTLTVGEMTARKVVTAERAYTVVGEGYRPEGVIFTERGEPVSGGDSVLRAVLAAAVGCIDGDVEHRDGRIIAVGDPTEAALAILGTKGGMPRAGIEQEMPRLGTLPFDSDRKRMTVLRRREGEPWALVKGAPEVILERCGQVLTASGPQPLGEATRAAMSRAAALLANDALRVLAVAERRLPAWPSEAEVESELTLLGLIGLQDPPRAEAREAVARCKRAGIRTVMITGDHPDTARAIARELGILDRDDEVLVGRELDTMDAATLVERVRRIRVYARVTAEHKLRIVRAWKATGTVVAMTGDGVNDAPALKEASIGIAMGISGTEVTKEAADMVITDDNFASIVAAVEEGRGIFDNISKTLGYLLAGNVGELALMLAAVLIGWPLPLLPIQLLWINLVTDGLPALALATDPIEAGILERPPRPATARLIDRRFLLRLALIGSLTATVSLAAFAYELRVDGDLANARNAAFSVLVIAELLRSFGARSETRSIWEVGLFSNVRLFLIVAVSFALQLVIHHSPLLERIFETEPISVAQCAAWIGLGLIPVSVLEAVKLVHSRGSGRSALTGFRQERVERA